MCTRLPGAAAAAGPPATRGAGGSGAWSANTLMLSTLHPRVEHPAPPLPATPGSSLGLRVLTVSLTQVWSQVGQAPSVCSGSGASHPRLIPVTGSGCGRKMLAGEGLGSIPEQLCSQNAVTPAPAPGGWPLATEPRCPCRAHPGGVGAGEERSWSWQDPRSTPDPEVPPREAIRWETPGCPLAPTECVSSNHRPGSGCWRLAWAPRHEPWDTSLDKLVSGLNSGLGPWKAGPRAPGDLFPLPPVSGS